MKMRFLTEPALLVDNILVIADLHIGIEAEISESGIIIPSQFDKMKSRIHNLIKETKAKHIILLGDIKHQVPGTSLQEYREIPNIFENLKVKITVVKGNHDGDIERLIPGDIDIYEGKGFKIDNFAFIHGHAWPIEDALDCEYLIMGHVHPAVEFWSDNIRLTEHCWLKCEINSKKLEEKYKKDCKLKKGIVMPSFNPIIGGMAFNSRKFKPIGPLLKNNILKWRESEVFLLDGTFLGNLNKIK